MQMLPAIHTAGTGSPGTGWPCRIRDTAEAARARHRTHTHTHTP